MAEPPHFYTRPTGFAQTVTINHLWQRYRYVYLNEEDVPYEEGQEDLCTCVWEVPELQPQLASWGRRLGQGWTSEHLSCSHRVQSCKVIYSYVLLIG